MALVKFELVSGRQELLQRPFTTMKITEEMIEAKARIFPQEVSEFLEIETDYLKNYKPKSKTKTMEERQAMFQTYNAKKLELKDLYKELGGHKHRSYYANIPVYKRLAIEETQKHLLASNPDLTKVRCTIARILTYIDKDWIYRAYYYHHGKYDYAADKYRTAKHTKEHVGLDFPGLIGFPDPKL